VQATAGAIAPALPRQRLTPAALVAASAILVFAAVFAYFHVKGSSRKTSTSGQDHVEQRAVPESAGEKRADTAQAEQATSTPSKADDDSDAVDTGDPKPAEPHKRPESALSRALSEQRSQSFSRNRAADEASSEEKGARSKISGVRADRRASATLGSSEAPRRQGSQPPRTSISPQPDKKAPSPTAWDPTNPGF
jgi:hypothetical protein